MAKSKAEIETIVRWDEEEKTAHMWTAHAATGRKWEKRGYAVTWEKGTAMANVPAKLISFRNLTRAPRPGAGAHLRKSAG